MAEMPQLFRFVEVTYDSHPSDADTSFANLLLNWRFFYHRAGGGMDHPDRAYSELSSCTALLQIPPSNIVKFGRRRGYVFQTWQEDAKAANCLKQDYDSGSTETISRVLSQHASSRFRRCSQSPTTKGDSRFRRLSDVRLDYPTETDQPSGAQPEFAALNV
jgi:hypothetical protein